MELPVNTTLTPLNETFNYALVYITMSRRFVLVKRGMGKIDVMLSYAGGLFSILIALLSIFLLSYNVYRYELLIAETVSPRDDDGNRIQASNFNFYKYIKYEMYTWLNTLFCLDLRWADCRTIDEARREINSNIDVSRLFKNLAIKEMALASKVEEAERDCLKIVKPSQLYEIRRNRLILDYYSHIVHED